MKKIAVVLFPLVLGGCGEIREMARELFAPDPRTVTLQDLQRLDICSRYVKWKDAIASRDDLNLEYVEVVDKISVDFIATCDDDPETTTKYTLDQLESSLSIMETTS